MAAVSLIRNHSGVLLGGTSEHVRLTCSNVLVVFQIEANPNHGNQNAGRYSDKNNEIRMLTQDEGSSHHRPTFN